MLAIDARSVHIWLLDFTAFTDPQALAKFEILLSDEEKSRRDRFAFPALKHHYLVSRAMLRCCLSRYAEVAPQDWVFAFEEQGKPYLTNAPIPLAFNLTHSGERAALAVTMTTPIGVDIEQVSRKRDWIGIAESYFHPHEFQQLQTLPGNRQHEFFFQLWTLKEAYFKARGTGIVTGLHKAAFNLDKKVAVNFAPDLADDPRHWHFYNYLMGDDYSLSLAINAPADQAVQLEFFQFDSLSETQSNPPWEAIINPLAKC